MGMSALAWAAKQGKLEVVIFLIKKGADINARDNKKHTPLACAISLV